MSIENQNPNYGYTRRQELSCTLDELANYSNVVLLDREVLYVKQADGTYDIKIGDNKTTVGELPYVIRHSELKSFKEAAEAARAAAETARDEAQTAEQNAKDALTNVNNSISRLETSKATVESVAAVAKQVDNLNQQTSEALASVRKRVANLEGAAIDFVADSAEAVTKTVPTGALPYAKIMKIGGKTYVEDKTLKSAPVSELVSEGENLTPFPYNDGDAGSVIEKYGVTFTVNSDGSITINGTSTEFATFALSSNIAFKAGETYARTPSESSISFVISYIEDGTTQYLSGPSFIWGGGWIFKSAYLQISPGTTVNNVTFRPMINKGSTLLPYRPYFKSTFLIPEAVRPANGINENVYDYIEWSEDGTRKKYKCVGVVNMGTLNWTTYNGEFTVRDLNKKNGGYNLLSPIYINAGEYQHNAHDESIMGYPSVGWITVKDTKYSDVASFKSAMSGVMLYYELAGPEVTDISNVLTVDNFIGVEGGGTITAVSGGKGAPTTIYYATEKTGG